MNTFFYFLLILLGLVYIGAMIASIYLDLFTDIFDYWGHRCNERKDEDSGSPRE